MIVALLLSVVLDTSTDRFPTPERASPQAIACNREGSTPEINACAASDLEREEARMQRYLRAAMDRARDADGADRVVGGPSAQRGYLDASQSAWKAYADIVCNGVLDAWKDGSIRTFMYLGCMTRMTRDRTHLIWRDHLTYADNTPPILPEPVQPAPD